MSERTRRKGDYSRNEMFRIYAVEKQDQATFLLQVDWLLENAVYPSESDYADNLAGLWNVYMPNYPFDQVVLQYSKKYFPVLRFVHDGEIYIFNSVKLMQETAIKNYVKFLISQGESNRMALVRECFDVFKDAADRQRLYEQINDTIDAYFVKGEIQQVGIMFLKRFQDYSEQPYKEILNRLIDIHDQKNQEFNARRILLNELHVDKNDEERFLTLINILLCRLATASGEKRFSDTLKDVWKETISDLNYNDAVYTFIDKFEKSYMNAACFGIKQIGDGKVIQKLYKDAVILCAVLEAVEKGNHYGIRDVNDFWKRDGMLFSKGYFFDDEYDRMKAGFNAELLIQHKSDIRRFHALLVKKIKRADFTVKEINPPSKGRTNTLKEMEHVTINEMERQIEELQEHISELEEKTETIQKEVLSQFISLLDSKKYDHVLGKLYRMAYSADEVKMEEIKIVLKNLFEIMNISGIDIYGKIDEKVDSNEIKLGRYRLDSSLNGKAFVKYPGYKIGNSVILHPSIEEV